MTDTMTPSSHSNTPMADNTASASAMTETSSMPPNQSIRQAQKAWQERPIQERLHLLKKARFELLKMQDELVSAVNEIRVNRSPADSLSAEILPLLSAIRFLEKKGKSILKSRKYGPLSAEIWLKGVAHEIRHEPHGLVLIIAPSNYPLFLFATQAVQALAAGNAVILKPAPRCAKPMHLFSKALTQAGLPTELIHVTEDTLEAGLEVMQRGVDHVVLTGSAKSGTAVMKALADDLTPSTMELSGADAFLVCEDADLDQAVRTLKFGLFINDGATCIAPRRVILHDSIYDQFVEKLKLQLTELPQTQVSAVAATTASVLVKQALAQGAEALTESAEIAEQMTPVVLTQTQTSMPLLQADVFVPVTSLMRAQDHAEMLHQANDCQYGLASSVFTRSPQAAAYFASGIDAGMVMVNDHIVPSADPRVPFVGRKHSGFEATQGVEGLLRMTRLKVISHRQFGAQPYIEERHPHEEEMLKLLIQSQHAPGFGQRLISFLKLGLASMKSSSP